MQAAKAALAEPRQRLREARSRLLELAQDVRSHLRLSVEPGMRVAAALLLAGSMAACVEMDPPDAITTSPGEQAQDVRPLTQEIKFGLPTKPGSYPLKGDEVRRDPQGVYFFSWREPDGSATAWRNARSSLVRLQSGDSDILEVPTSGDPILKLKSDTPVMLSAAGGNPVSTPTAGNTVVHYGTPWYPLYHGVFGPSYYDPPRTVSGGATALRESRPSEAPRSTTERTASVPAASGKAGGTGSGTAASSKLGVSSGGVSGTLAASGVSSSVGVASAKSSGFSSGSSSSSSSSSS
ncbi:MAG: hypothetical protein EXR51_06585 [Dehalococcoidia bacterium]|nr:hypothetical protein [Dehalococcoidia bacterium]